MDIQSLRMQSREIWGEEKLSLSQVVVRLGVIFGNICRWERDADKDQAKHSEDELKKQLGNVIFSTIRWCDDLGFDPEECVQRAMTGQREFVKENKKR